MTVDEIFTKFKFSADTGKVNKFGKAVDKMQEGIGAVDNKWSALNSKLAGGFSSPWFAQFSNKVTDLRRVQLFMGGIRRGFEFAEKAVPGMGKLTNAVTAVTQKYNRFVSTLVNARSAVRSFGTILGKSLKNVGPMIKAQARAIGNGIKAGFSRAALFIKNLDFNAIATKMKAGLRSAAAVAKKGLSKIVGFFKVGFAKIHASMLASNNKLISGFGNMLSGISNKFKGMKGLSRFGGKIQGLTKNIPGLGKLTASFSKLGLGAGVAIAGIVAGVIAAIAVIVKLVKTIKQSVKDFINFEAAMKGVQRVTLASAEDMERLEAAALKAGEASIFGVKDVADAEKFLAMAGLSVDQVIGALPGTLQLAAAAEMDLARAADIATNIMSSNALQVSDLTRVNDVLAYSASNSNQSVEQLGSAIQRVGPAGRLASLSIEEMSAWLSIMANNGLKGEEAGTMLRNAIKDLMTPSSKMTAALVAGGVAIGDFVNEAGQIENLQALLVAMENMDAVKKQAFLASLDERSWKAIAPIITGNTAALGQFNEELKGAEGTAAQMASIAFQGLDGAIKEYKSKMEASRVGFVKNSGMNELLTNIVKMASDSLPTLFTTLGLLLGPIVKILWALLLPWRVAFVISGGIFKVLNKVWKAAWAAVNKIWKPIEKSIAFIFQGVRKIFTGLGDMEKGPLWLIQVALTGIGNLFGRITVGILNMMGPLLFVTDVILTALLKWIPGGLRLLGGVIKEKLFTPISEFFKAVGMVVKAIWDVYIAPVFVKIGEKFMSVAMAAGNFLVKIFDPLFQKLKGPFEWLYNKFIVPIGKFFEGVGGKIGDLAGGIGETFVSVKDNFAAKRARDGSWTDQLNAKAASINPGQMSPTTPLPGAPRSNVSTTNNSAVGGPMTLNVAGMSATEVKALTDKYQAEQLRGLKQEVGI